MRKSNLVYNIINCCGYVAVAILVAIVVVIGYGMVISGYGMAIGGCNCYSCCGYGMGISGCGCWVIIDALQK